MLGGFRNTANSLHSGIFGRGGLSTNSVSSLVRLALSTNFPSGLLNQVPGTCEVIGSGSGIGIFDLVTPTDSICFREDKPSNFLCPTDSEAWVTVETKLTFAISFLSASSIWYIKLYRTGKGTLRIPHWLLIRLMMKVMVCSTGPVTYRIKDGMRCFRPSPIPRSIPASRTVGSARPTRQNRYRYHAFLSFYPVLWIRIHWIWIFESAYFLEKCIVYVYIWLKLIQIWIWQNEADPTGFGFGSTTLHKSKYR